ncbi:MAG: hypothetical protein JWN76_3783 [Chitinophagaceae bacterium]|nr:hypothetical protein [Chitinophagaceae bacterium]
MEYLLVGLIVMVINIFWLQKTSFTVVVKALLHAFICSVVLIIYNAILHGLSNLWPFAFIVYGVPVFLIALLIHFILFTRKKRTNSSSQV